MKLNYYIRSFKTKSYWSYALLTIDSVKTFMAVVGGIWLFIDIFLSIGIFEKAQVSRWFLLHIAIFALVVVVFTRRPLTKITYKHPGKDLAVEVCIDDIFAIKGQKIIGTNTTFDTDLSNNIISPRSLQGQFTEKFFPNNISELDARINQQLEGSEYIDIQKDGKTKKYPFGTVIKFNLQGEFYYWFAMAEMNSSNNVKTTLNQLQKSLEGLWDFMEVSSERMPIIIPLVGSAFGRIGIKRKKLIALIAQTFIASIESADATYVDKLIIVVSPKDVERFELNLFEVKDMLKHYLP